MPRRREEEQEANFFGSLSILKDRKFRVGIFFLLGGIIASFAGAGVVLGIGLAALGMGLVLHAQADCVREQGGDSRYIFSFAVIFYIASAVFLVTASFSLISPFVNPKPLLYSSQAMMLFVDTIVSFLLSPFVAAVVFLTRAFPQPAHVRNVNDDIPNPIPAQAAQEPPQNQEDSLVAQLLLEAAEQERLAVVPEEEGTRQSILVAAQEAGPVVAAGEIAASADLPLERQLEGPFNLRYCLFSQIRPNAVASAAPAAPAVASAAPAVASAAPAVASAASAVASFAPNDDDDSRALLSKVVPRQRR